MKIDNWVTSNGGPLILLPENLLSYWEGTDPPNGGRTIEANFRWDPTGPATDYDRACDIADYIGLIEVGPGHALILGDMPMPTNWWPLPTTEGGILVRWMFADNDHNVIQAVQNLSIGSFQPAELTFSVTCPTLVLFDSAFPGVDKDCGATLTITLKEGVYGISTLHYTPDQETSLVLHRLSPLESNLY